MTNNTVYIMIYLMAVGVGMIKLLWKMRIAADCGCCIKLCVNV